MKMTVEESSRRHRTLHDSLVDLIIDWVAWTKGNASESSVTDLLKWSSKQAGSEITDLLDQLEKQKLCVPPVTYLAAPYSHPLAAVREQRFLAVSAFAAKLMQEGTYVFSPISHSHPIAQAGMLPYRWNYWAGYDKLMLRTCNKVIVLMLDGWRESAGVAAEVACAEELGLPVEYVDA